MSEFENCELECGAVGNYCRCRAEKAQAGDGLTEGDCMNRSDPCGCTMDRVLAGHGCLSCTRMVLQGARRKIEEMRAEKANLEGLTAALGAQWRDDEWVVPFCTSDGTQSMLPVDECQRRRAQAAATIEAQRAALARLRAAVSTYGGHGNPGCPDRVEGLLALEQADAALATPPNG